jgi:type I restriction enzyme R subunit
VFSFHKPEELKRLVEHPLQVRSRLKQMPPRDETKLWTVQAVAIRELAKSRAANRSRALIQLATGSGKTFTAVTYSSFAVLFR